MKIKPYRQWTFTIIELTVPNNNRKKIAKVDNAREIGPRVIHSKFRR